MHTNKPANIYESNSAIFVCFYIKLLLLYISNFSSTIFAYLKIDFCLATMFKQSISVSFVSLNTIRLSYIRKTWNYNNKAKMK